MNGMMLINANKMTYTTGTPIVSKTNKCTRDKCRTSQPVDNYDHIGHLPLPEPLVANSPSADAGPGLPVPDVMDVLVNERRQEISNNQRSPSYFGQIGAPHVLHQPSPEIEELPLPPAM